MNFEQLITSLQPINGAIDGTPRPKLRKQRNEHHKQANSPMVRKWRCRLCHHEEQNQDAMIAHLQTELVEKATTQQEKTISRKTLTEVAQGLARITESITNGELTAHPGTTRLLRGAAFGLALAATFNTNNETRPPTTQNKTPGQHTPGAPNHHQRD